MRARVTFIAVFILTILAAYQMGVAEGQMSTDGLVSYWSFDQAHVDGETAKDGWGDNDGEIMGGFEIVEGKVGEAIQLPAAQAGLDYVEMPDNDDLDPENLTYMCWLKINATTLYANVISRDDGTGIGHCLQARGSEDVFRMWVVVDGVIDNAEAATKVSSCVGEWTHIAGTFDGDKISIYINGVLEATKDMPGEAGCADQTQLCVGGQFAGAAVVSELLNGVIDEVYVYSRALSEDEIAQSMNSEGLAVLSSKNKLAVTWGEMKVSE